MSSLNKNDALPDAMSANSSAVKPSKTNNPSNLIKKSSFKHNTPQSLQSDTTQNDEIKGKKKDQKEFENKTKKEIATINQPGSGFSNI